MAERGNCRSVFPSRSSGRRGTLSPLADRDCDCRGIAPLKPNHGLQRSQAALNRRRAWSEKRSLYGVQRSLGTGPADSMRGAGTAWSKQGHEAGLRLRYCGCGLGAKRGTPDLHRTCRPVCHEPLKAQKALELLNGFHRLVGGTLRCTGGTGSGLSFCLCRTANGTWRPNPNCPTASAVPAGTPPPEPAGGVPGQFSLVTSGEDAVSGQAPGLPSGLQLDPAADGAGRPARRPNPAPAEFQAYRADPVACQQRSGGRHHAAALRRLLVLIAHAESACDRDGWNSAQ